MWQEHTRLPAFYDRVEKAIRAVDRNHILWLDGNTFAIDFRAFKHTLPNCVYSLHDYAVIISSWQQKEQETNGIT